MTSAAVETRYGPVVAVVGSESEPGKQYEVRRAFDGTMSCQCMGYRFNRMCKHIIGTQLDMGIMPTQSGKKHVALPKIKTPPVSHRPQRSTPHEQPSVTARIQQEATAVATKIRNTTMAEQAAIGLVEAAIRKFMATVAAPVADAMQPALVTEGSVRMIILED